MSDSITINEAERTQIITDALSIIETQYVFPELAAQMVAHVQAREAAGVYADVSDGAEFAELLTADLRSVTNDRHLGIRYSADTIPVRKERTTMTPEEEAKQQTYLRRHNHFFESVTRLPGNIGYLDFRAFDSPHRAADQAVAAYQFLADTDCMIVDLRKNGGGDPAMVIFMCSYFFPADQRTHLNSIYSRLSDETTQFWSADYFPLPRYVDKPLYVLTSSYTFSGAEEFAYNMQTQQRGTLIGETTGGGAHPTRRHRLHAHFMIGVPFARSINPITGTNWEGTGIMPDVAVPAGQALLVAQQMALQTLIEQCEDDSWQGDLEKALLEVNAGLETEQGE